MSPRQIKLAAFSLRLALGNQTVKTFIKLLTTTRGNSQRNEIQKYKWAIFNSDIPNTALETTN